MSEFVKENVRMRRREGFKFEFEHLSSSSRKSLLSESTYNRSQNVKVSTEVALDFLPCLVGNDDDNEGEVCCLALSANLLFTASSMSIIRAWELPLPHHHHNHHHGHEKGKRKVKGMGEGKMGGVKVMKVMGEMIVSGHEDCKIRIWQRCKRGAEYKLVATLPTLKDYLLNLIPPSTFLKVRRHHRCLWVEHADTISALAMARIDEESVLYSGSWDRTVKVWRMSDLRCIESFYAHDDAINAIAVASDGLLYTGSADTKIKVWCFQNTAKKEKRHSLVATLRGHNYRSSINALVLISNGTLLYSGSSDTTIIVWGRCMDNALHMIPMAVLHGHRHAVLCLALAYANNDQILCSGSADNTVRVWRCMVGSDSDCEGHFPPSYSCLAVLGGHNAAIKSICVSIAHSSPTTINIYSNSLDNQLKMCSVFIPHEDSRGLEKCIPN